MNNNKIIFDKNHISANYEWFKNELDDNFKIEVKNNQSIIIFGYNGIGKSTIFKCLLEQDDKCLFCDYIENNLLQCNNNKIKLAIKINEIENLKEEINNLNEKLKIKNYLNQLGITNKEKRKAIFGEKIDSIVEDFKCNEKQFFRFLNDFKSINLKNYVTLYEQLKKVNDVELEIENDNSKTLFNVLSDINKITSDDDKICKVCGSEVDNLKIIIQEKIKHLNNVKSDLIDLMKQNNIEYSSEMINKFIELFNSLENDSDLKYCILMCNGDINIYKEITNTHQELKQKKNLLNEYEKNKINNYENVVAYKQSITKDFARYLQIDESKIFFNDQQYEIEFDLDRNIETYSTGERNMISFLYNIYSFLGSNNDYLILDDPVSSFDLINQYKIAFELVEKISNSNKSIIILTHFIDLLNITYLQYKKKFTYYYLEKYNGKIYSEIISEGKDNVLSINNLDDNITLDNINFKGIIDLLKKRDLKDDVNKQKIFHYSVDEIKVENVAFTNYSFIKLIEKIGFEENLTKGDFKINAMKKIIYMVALRIYVENCLYDLLDYFCPTENKDFYFEKNTIGYKISCIFSKCTGTKKDEYKELKTFLNSKKVMMNQSIHYDSQIDPLSFALNLSLDDLIYEIRDIKTKLTKYLVRN